jgi:hypothetical protein
VGARGVEQTPRPQSLGNAGAVLSGSNDERNTIRQDGISAKRRYRIKEKRMRPSHRSGRHARLPAWRWRSHVSCPKLKHLFQHQRGRLAVESLLVSNQCLCARAERGGLSSAIGMTR